MVFRFRSFLAIATLMLWSQLMPVDAQQTAGTSSSPSGGFDNAAITGNAGGNQLVTIVQRATNSIYQVFRTVSAGWLVLWCVFLGVAMAFGQATGDDVRNLIFGGAVVVGANVLATSYYAVYFSATGAGN